MAPWDDERGGPAAECQRVNGACGAGAGAATRRGGGGGTGGCAGHIRERGAAGEPRIVGRRGGRDGERRYAWRPSFVFLGFLVTLTVIFWDRGQ